MSQSATCWPWYIFDKYPSYICLLSPEHRDINLNAQTFSTVSPVLDRPNSEFVNNYNLRCSVDLLADEIVSIEIDQEESISAGEDLTGDIIAYDDHPRCTYYTRHSSIYENVDVMQKVIIKDT